MRQICIKITLFIFLVFILTFTGFSQTGTDTSDNSFKHTGSITLTSNGIAPIPSFSLEKPSMHFVSSMQKKRFSHYVEFALSLDAKPWYIDNFFRYRVIESNKFNIGTGVLWSFDFTIPAVFEDEYGIIKKVSKPDRYLFLELAPEYSLSEKSTLQGCYWYGHGFDKGTLESIHFIYLKGNFTQSIFGDLCFELSPQVYYLLLSDNGRGMFMTATINISHKQFPVSLSSLVNQSLTTTISPDPGFSWNISLIYPF